MEKLKTVKNLESRRTHTYKDHESEDGATFDEVIIWESELRQEAVKLVKKLLRDAGMKDEILPKIVTFQDDELIVLSRDERTYYPKDIQYHIALTYIAIFAHFFNIKESDLNDTSKIIKD